MIMRAKKALIFQKFAAMCENEDRFLFISVSAMLVVVFWAATEWGQPMLAGEVEKHNGAS